MKNEIVPVCLSLGLIARNGESTIKTTLESLFQQSIFAKLSACGGRCEVLCLAYGCTDRTAEVAREVLTRMEQQHPHASAFSARVAEISESAKDNAWNLFVHEFSSPVCRYIFVMDDDTAFFEADTIYHLAGTLERNPSASLSTSRHYRDMLFKARPRRVAVAAGVAEEEEARRPGGGQLYCLRASIARQIFPPRDPGVAGDGFLKSAISTDFFFHAPDPSRIVFAPDAAPVFPIDVTPRGARPAEKRRNDPTAAARPERWESESRRGASRRPARASFLRRLLFKVSFKRLWRQRRLSKSSDMPEMMAGLAPRFPGGEP